MVQTRAYDYSPTTGLLTKEIVEPGSSALCLVTAYTLDAFGNRRQTTVRNCNGSAGAFSGSPAEAPAPATGAIAPRVSKEEFTYNANGSVTVLSTNAASTTALPQQQTRVHDAASGALVSQQGPNLLRDANGNVVYSQWAYDNFGRKVLEKKPDGNGSTISYERCNLCPSVNGVSPAYMVTTKPVAGPIDLATRTTGPQNGPIAKVYYDALDRPVRTETQGSDVSGTSALIYQDTVYDALGRVSFRSVPYASNTPTASGTTTSYDLWGRPVSATAPDGGVTTTAYEGLSTRVTVDYGQTTRKLRNVLGQVVQVTDANGKVLSLSYDPLGNLLQSTDSAGNTVSMRYDVRGRKLDLQDPDMGSWTYGYDAVGNLTRQTDARAQTTVFTYDVLNRLVSRQEPTLNTSWTYDTCAQGIGQLCQASAANGYSRSLSYDRLGRVAGESVMPGSTTYTSALEYDANGRVQTLRYPGTLALRQAYTALGYLKQVLDAGSGASYWRADAADAWGHVTQVAYGNGVVTQNAYDARTGRLLSSSAGSLLNLVYAYDVLGNLRVRSDGVTGVAATYTYDALNRLTSETRSGGALASAQTISWVYDEIGNVRSRSDVGTFSYPPSGSARPHAVSSVAGTVNGVSNPLYTYDGNGNLMSVAGTGGSQALGWNSFNKVDSVARTFAGHTNRLDYLYDADRERVREVFSRDGVVQRTTVYWHPSAGGGLFFEEESSASGVRRRHYLSAGGQVFGMIVSKGSLSAIQYWHKDHLDSLVAVSDGNGALVEQLAYEPFGKRRLANGLTDANGTLAATSTDRGFTGHEQLDEVALVNMNGRVYDPALGRFLSPDPLVSAPLFMQDFNRYSYVVNNPLKFFDPTGYSGEFSCGPDFDYESLFPGGPAPKAAVAGTGSSASVGSWISSAILAAPDLRASILWGANANTYGTFGNNYFFGAGPFTNASGGLKGTAGSADAAIQRYQQCGSDTQCIATSRIEMLGIQQEMRIAGLPLQERLAINANIAQASMLLGEPGAALQATASLGIVALTNQAGSGSTKGLPDSALVCRGGLCTADRFAGGSGVKIDAAGKMSGASVNSAADKTLNDLSATIPNPKVGVTTVGDIRRAGGDVVPKPTFNNPFHCEMCGITPQQAERLFRVVPNPNR